MEEKFPELLLGRTKAPLVFLGNQRSGSSAVSNLFAKATALSLCSDIGSLQQSDIEGVFYGEESFARFVKKYPRCFSKKVIKEPTLTFLFDEFDSYYSGQASYFFIVRDPFQNIRSILDKVGVPGDLKSLDSSHLSEVKLEWQKIVLNDWLGLSYSNYIESLAKRWEKAVGVYLEHQDRMTLIRYEDFLDDKASYIYDLAVKKELKVSRSIEGSVDSPFQSTGSNIRSDGRDFFGPDNYETIRRVCGSRMKELGYA